ncbi:hypothetical protein QZQ15_09770 [Serratia marcescens]|uniref:hypothetical protein n=1 Tax=Serratia marcescens TaxID=615 RepID=UPI0027911C8E|nr:hypothetical protein [Serratia marcescens]MDP8798279.1 hypothetical protein [Serratia marcescens]
MDNKLSELSKPVAWVLGTPSCKHLTADAEYADWYLEHGSTAAPLYSQEYVSALLAELEFEKQNNAGVAGMIEDYETKLEAKDERIGELEAIATDYAGKFQKAQDANKHLIIMSNDDKRRIAELDAHNECLLKKNADLTQQNIKLGERLATPVRLLGEMLLHDWEHRVEQQAAFEHRKIAWDARLAEDKKAILAAGFTFTVEGDE